MQDTASSDSSSPLGALHQVHKAYGPVAALQGIDLQVHAGQLLALLGANGAGKSTAINLMLGLVRPDAGQVRLFGDDPQHVATRRGIGLMLQQAQLPPNLRVGELIAQTRSYYPQPRSVAESAQLAGVDALLRRQYHTLSGGQQRSVQFALALCGRPRLLFLDEPSVGMDVHARQQLWRAVRHLLAEGNAVLVTTHYLEEAEALADRVCVLRKGRIVSDGSVQALRDRVARKQVLCQSRLALADVQAWTEVCEARMQGDRLLLATDSAEALVRRLLLADPDLHGLEVQGAGLADAFLDLIDNQHDAAQAVPEAA